VENPVIPSLHDGSIEKKPNVELQTMLVSRSYSFLLRGRENPFPMLSTKKDPENGSAFALYKAFTETEQIVQSD
jgi:hypothetical protein